ncbi:uncharacterized protein L201_004910 [Kwoniella dendrophila CBS 6074]|uniref:Zn(2)-C6 fungal-type domain-containing protein n=1 Tax=Kwoniella dendrophila CBS 6074 TaxID=1295534 RepID=A0AAX4JX18_9TREE
MPSTTPSASAGSSRRTSGEEPRRPSTTSTSNSTSTPRSASGSGSTLEPKTAALGRKTSNNANTSLSQKQKELAEAEAKRRKVQRACDACRRKKIKCEGPMNSLSDSKCTHCQEYGLDCTYVEAAKRRGPPKGYIETLEQRCSRLERILHQLQPNIDLNEYVGPPLDKEEFDLPSYQDTLRSLHIPPFPSLKPYPSISGRHSTESPAAGTGSPPVQVLGASPWKAYERDPAREPTSEDQDDAHMHVSIADTLSKLNVKDTAWRYHGKASGAHLMRTFHELKYMNPSQGETKDFLAEVNKNKRSQYWLLPEWELVIANEGIRSLDLALWPEEGFDMDLIDAYFENVNPHLPLLNGILFKRQYESGLWRTNTWFAKVCLMIFANGSRFVDDERVYWPVDLALSEEGKERLKSDQDGSLRYSAGWKYLHALLRMGRSIMQGPNLYEFQTQVLLCNFLSGSAVPHLMWILSGLGLRSAQEIGIHVRSTLAHVDPVERALYNRAFWCLYHIDRVNCAGVGRSVALQDTDFDADYPIDVDDEYWDTGDREKDFKQPEEAGISSIAAFIQTLKLDHIIGAALRTIYAINKLPEHHADVAAQSAVVVELDSALNSWADNVPDGLRWDPTRANYQLFQQSALLYVHYYYCQILVHRPFIPTPRNRQNGQVFLPSLAICANAARSICNIVDTALKRGRQEGALPGRALNVGYMLPGWVAVIVLLINVYSGKQSPAERERAISDIKRCVAASREMEMVWRQAGKMTDMMVELASEHDMPSAVSTPKGEKRGHSSDFNQACFDNSPTYQGSPHSVSPSSQTTTTPQSHNQHPHHQPHPTQSRLNGSFGPNFDEPRLLSATTPAINDSSQSTKSSQMTETTIDRLPTPPGFHASYMFGKPYVEVQNTTHENGYPASSHITSAAPPSGLDGLPPSSSNMTNLLSRLTKTTSTESQSMVVDRNNNNNNDSGNGNNNIDRRNHINNSNNTNDNDNQFQTFMGGSLPINNNSNYHQSQSQQQQQHQNQISNTINQIFGGNPQNNYNNLLGINQNTLDNSLFDLGSSAFDFTGQGVENDIWTQLFTDYTGQNVNGGDWNWNTSNGTINNNNTNVNNTNNNNSNANDNNNNSSQQSQYNSQYQQQPW